MSLINRMLQDLEARRAAGQEQTLLRDVRPLPARRESSWLRPVATGALLAALLGVGFLIWQQMQDQVPPLPAAPPKPLTATPAVPLPPQSAPAEAVAAAPSATTPPVSPSPATEPAPPATAAAALPAPAPVSAAPPLAPIAEAQKTAPAAADPARPAAKGEAGASEKDESLKVATTLSPAPGKSAGDAAAKPPKAEPPAVIEKKVRNASPKERAENDYRRAQALLGQGRSNDALAGFAAALQADPAHTGARLDMANLLVDQHRLADAQALLEEGLGPNPGQTQLAMRLARIQAERGDLRAAAQTLQKAAAGSAGHAEFRAFHAAVLQRLTLHKEAVTEYQAALKLVPQAGVWWMGLGLSLEADGRPAEAREAYQRARASGTLSVELTAFVDQKLKQLQ